MFHLRKFFNRPRCDCAAVAGLRSKVVEITGDASIGKESARVLLARGAHVILCTRTVKDGEATVAEFGPKAQANSTCVALDLEHPTSINACATATCW